MSVPAHSSPTRRCFLGLATSSAHIVATGAVPTIFQPRPWGRMNAGRRQTPAQSAWSKTAHLPSACARLSRSREKAIVEVVTPIAVGDNAFGRLSSLQRPFRNGRHRGRAKTMIRASIRIGAIAMFGLASAIPGASQDMMQHVDLTSPEMASAEMTRAEVEAAIASATSLQPADLTGKSSRASTSQASISPLRFCAARGSTGPNFAMQNSTGRFSIKLGSWRPISVERASPAQAFLLRKCSVRRSTEPTSQARASRPI